MTERSFFRRLHGSALRVQVPLVLATIPAAALLYAVAVAPVIVDVAMADAGAPAQAAARTALLAVAATMVACVAVATLGAALLLRGSVRTVVERLLEATGAIAHGDFGHRIRSDRTDELGRLAGSIDVMAERLERLEEARRRLLACVSHELRTPLTIIRGHAFTLARREANAVRRERLELVEAEAVRLAELIEDLVDASSLQAGSVRLRIERCDLARLVESTASRFVEEAAMRGVALELRGVQRPIVVDADPARIEQVLSNLVGNAVRHANAGTAITVQVASRRGAAWRSVSVRNHGPAVTADLAERIFEPFVQGEGGTGRVGLGLSIAHGLAAAHGGALTLESTGNGDDAVEFRLTLPPPGRVDPAAASRAPQPGRAHGRLQLAET